MENIMVFDTETTDINKPFCYNIGYIIANEKGETLLEKSFVVEQIWHNLPLFTTAYYAEKRPLYVTSMKARKTIMKKFGYICQEMARDIKAYGVKLAFAYNSPFDEKVFAYNCDWFKCINPFDNVVISDIRAFVHTFLVDKEYKAFCESNGLFTESGNYSTTAETVKRYIDNNTDFIEDHTALSDSKIEKEILFACIARGAKLDGNYQVMRSIERKIERELKLTTTDKQEFLFKYNSIRISKDKTKIVLR